MIISAAFPGCPQLSIPELLYTRMVRLTDSILGNVFMILECIVSKDVESIALVLCSEFLAVDFIVE